MKTKCILFLLFILISKISFQQAPDIEWQNTIGGASDDFPRTIMPVSGGGYIIGGTSESDAGGDKSENNLGESYIYPEDYWVVKIDSIGTVVWENTLGGNKHDWLSAALEAEDGGYIISGESTSEMGADKSEDGCGGPDMWIIKLTEEGEIDWENSIGGLNYDYAYEIAKTPSGGYLIGGNSASNISCDKTIDHYGYWEPHDFWLVKINLTGEVEWQVVLGGEETDVINSMQSTSDGGYILGGYTNSSATDDISDTNNGENDYWVIKIDSLGNIEWESLYGGSNYDFLTTVCETSEGDYLVGGYSYSDSSGDKSEASLGYDYWILKLDPDGNIIWENTIGTIGEDVLYMITPTYDGNFILGGYSTTLEIDGDKSVEGYGDGDFWLIKMNADGDFLWQKVIGGSGGDFLKYVSEANDYGLIIIGSSESGVSGLKTETSMGAYDYWVLKLFPECTVNQYYADKDEDGYGDLYSDTLACNIPEGFVIDNSDCADTSNLIHPGLLDNCNLIDDNCNGLIDEDASTFNQYKDFDGDGYGNSANDTISCFELTGYVTDTTDCNDFNPEVNPAADELCNSLDDDCDGVIDNDLIFYTYFLDSDGDTFGDPILDSLTCTGITGYVIDSTDCNDSNPEVNPFADEFCNGIDDDCDGYIDNDIFYNTYFADADGDSYGDPLSDTLLCIETEGYILNDNDCDDTNPDIYPGAPELLNGLDDDCDGYIDEFLSIQFSEIKGLKIYPNPVKSNLIIENPNREFTLIEIISSTGQSIYSTSLSAFIEIDMHLFVNGIYFLKIKSPDREIGMKLVKD